MAEFFAVSERTILDWTREGLPVARATRRGQPNAYDSSAAVTWFAMREVRRRCGGSGEGLDERQERAALFRTQRERLRQTIDREAGRLLDRAEVLACWQAGLSVLRARLLVLPSRVAPLLADQPLAHAEVEALVRGPVREALDELARGDGVPASAPPQQERAEEET